MSDNETDKRKAEIAELTHVMSQPSGRSVIYRFLESTGVDESTFSPDTHQHACNAGRREVGLELKDELMTVTLDNYFIMIKENNNG